MKQIWSGIQIAFTAFGGFLGWFLGGVDGFLYALIAFTRNHKPADAFALGGSTEKTCCRIRPCFYR